VENQKKNTITIKIDGKSRTYQENKQKLKSEKVTSSKTFVEDDGRKLEFDKRPVVKPNIKEPNYEEVAAASAEKNEEDFDWILPEASEEPELEEYKIASYTSKPNKGKSVITALKKSKTNLSPSIFLAFFFAVIIGLSFGFILLRLVISDQTIGTQEVVTTITPTEQQQSDQENVTSYTLPVVSTFVVQESAYTTIEAANDGKKVLDQKGIPSAVVTTDKYLLLVGIGVTKENGKAIGARLVEKGIDDIYAKELQVGGIQLNEITSTEQKLLELASQLYAPLVTISTSLTLGQTIPEEASKNVTQMKVEWDKINSKEIKTESLIQLKEEMDKAIIVAMNPTKEKSTELQQHLLSFLSLYQTKK
jgi:stage II sporulation protein B